MTALERAIVTKNPSLAHLLLQLGARTDTLNFREHLLRTAANTGDVATYRILRDANFEVSSSLFPAVVSLGDYDLIEDFFLHSIQSDDYRSALQAALKRNDMSILRLILERKWLSHCKITSGGPEGDDLLCIAASLGNNEALQLILKAGVPFAVSGYSKKQETALQISTKKDYLEITESLLISGISTERHPTDHSHQLPTPLQIAARRNNLDMVRVLLKFGADANAPAATHPFHYGEPSESNEGGNMALGFAALNGNMEMVSALFEAGASVNIPGSTSSKFSLSALLSMSGGTQMAEHLQTLGASFNLHATLCPQMLIQAAKDNDIFMISQLLQAGIDVNSTYPSVDNGATALSEAILALPKFDTSDKTTITLLLANGAQINHPYAVPSALEAAVKVRHMHLVEYLLIKGAHPDHSAPLELAAKNGDHEIAKLLLQYSSDSGSLSQHRACYGHSALLAAARAGNDGMVRLLVEGGVNTVSSCMVYVLRAACFSQNSSLVEFILGNGSVVDIPKEANYCFAKTENGFIAPCESDWYDFEAVSPLQVLVSKRNKKLIKTLLQHGADINYKAKTSYHVFAWKTTALNLAIREGFLDIVEVLLNAKADVNIPASDYGHMTALQSAVEHGNMGIFEKLLAAGADINGKGTYKGGTALKIAAGRGYMKMASRLLELGADVNDFQYHQSALSNAARLGRMDMLKLLLNAGAGASNASIQLLSASLFAEWNGHYAAARYLESQSVGFEGDDNSFTNRMLYFSHMIHSKYGRISIE